MKHTVGDYLDSKKNPSLVFEEALCIIGNYVDHTSLIVLFFCLSCFLYFITQAEEMHPGYSKYNYVYLAKVVKMICLLKKQLIYSVVSMAAVCNYFNTFFFPS